MSRLHKIIHYGLAALWLVNGLYCKLLNLVPRHRQIVAAILGPAHAALLTTLIGVCEITMACWILSGYKSRFCAISQITLVAVMNSIEFFAAPGLLLWGRFNALFAGVLIGVIYYDEFFLHKTQMAA